MGYSTDFSGILEFSTPLTTAQVKYIQAFCRTRRMARDEAKAELLPDELRLAVGLPIGKDGGYYVGSVADGNSGQNGDPSVLDRNGSGSMPGLWCQWEVDDNGETLYWDGGEKFYNYVEWLQYLINNFFDVWGTKLNGSIDWVGEDTDDRGTITVTDSIVIAQDHTELSNESKKDAVKQFAEYLETIAPTNIMLSERKFVEIYNHWVANIYKS